MKLNKLMEKLHMSSFDFLSNQSSEIFLNTKRTKNNFFAERRPFHLASHQFYNSDSSRLNNEEILKDIRRCSITEGLNLNLSAEGASNNSDRLCSLLSNNQIVSFHFIAPFDFISISLFYDSELRYNKPRT